ncbi:two-component sensor histidine kinase [Streptomyces sp. WAC 01529]|uniref:sensor histidine kinase n=1 Tax=Streptomyces sp. WAC 01529 TaxID=2203205 RepID=UPI000F702C2A|nr:HAMP domain-containing sensor histidine kinase [Streptomyces sp. WAC 01529]AZM54233.1 two-component sensor histidine kinase [Streptomyces sp. WAC 01529]
MPRPRTLRTRLVLSAVALIAVVCAVIGTVTALALKSHLYEQLDGVLGGVAKRAAAPLPGSGSAPDSGPDSEPGSGPGSERPPERGSARLEGDDPLEFVSRGPQEIGTIGAEVKDGSVGRALVSTEARAGSGSALPVATPLDKAQKAALDSVPRDRRPHTVDIPRLGEYRVAYTTGGDGAFLVGVPTAKVRNTLDTLVVVEVSVTAAGLAAASLAGAVLVGVALRPLRRIAGTATRVSELPLHSGEVALHERAPDADPRTEVGQVGAALNRMLDHVHSALDARQQSETRVRRFVADASHELRTPLASIRGYAELTRRGRESTGPDTRHALRRIESEAERMTGLVEDLLLLARLDAEQQERAGLAGGGGVRPLSYRSCDLAALVLDAVGDARAAGPGHRWRLELPGPDEPALVRADADRLQQVVVNLLGNARTHTPPGTTVTARVRKDGPLVRLEIQDDGPGIAPDLLPSVFERFARGDASRSRHAGSTGLGLALVRALVTAHGGTVTVESVPGRTVFAVMLPAAGGESTVCGDAVAYGKEAPQAPQGPQAPQISQAPQASQPDHSLTTQP